MFHSAWLRLLARSRGPKIGVNLTLGLVALALTGCQAGHIRPTPAALSPVNDPGGFGLPDAAPSPVPMEFAAPGTPRGTVRSLARESEARGAAPDEKSARAQRARAETRARQIEVVRKEVTEFGALRHLRSRRMPESICRSRNLAGEAARHTFFSYARNSAVYVLLCGTQVVERRERPGATPAASKGEREEAIELAQQDPRLKDHLAELRAQALVTGDCQGRLMAGPCAHRTLFVTFSKVGEEVPRYQAEVDIAERRVLRAGPSAGAQSAVRPLARPLTPATLHESREGWEGDVAWKGWKFRYAMDEGEEAGLVIEDVEHQGRRFIRKMSLPVVRVKYLRNSYWYKPWTWRIFNRGCGPFKDQIDRDAIRTIERPVPAPGVSRSPEPCPHAICRREWSDGNVAWLEVGVYARIGQYHLYQAWYFSGSARDGAAQVSAQIVPALWSGGVACHMDHTHHPYWRLHFDLDGQGQDQVLVRRGGQWSLYRSEGDDGKTSDPSSTAWLVRRQASRRAVWILPGKDDGPADRFANHDFSVRRYQDHEDSDWEFDFYDDLGYADGESVDGQSNVVWYIAHMRHETGGESRNRWQWHVAGPSLMLQPGR